MQITGYLFDAYNFESEMHVWIKSDDGNMHLLTDQYHPVIYADAAPDDLRKLVNRLANLNALAEPPSFVTKRHFYENKDIQVLRLTISKPSLLTKIKQKLYALTDKIAIFHSDIEIPNGYLHEKHLFPFAPVVARLKKPPLFNQLDAIVALESDRKLDYKIPPLRTMEIIMEKSHRLPVSLNNPIILKYGTDSLALNGTDVNRDLKNLNQMILTYDPDVILTSYGDQKIMPTLFSWSSTTSIPLALDREQVPGLTRNISRKGLSVNSYGSTLFRAASYPLYGRLHIDSGNSFVFSNSDFAGVVELARLSRTPIQRVARTSTGAALTNMEVHNAMDLQYLVPWQKSKVESWRSVYAMIEGDKGGMTYVPDLSKGSVLENVVQLDYSQMYPSIMVNHNISPECVNCECCANDPDVPRTPESNWHICKKREGIVSRTLSHVLARRKYYKQLLKQAEDADINAKQGALKWLLVTSFGYLGYRNAKFGRLESHEAVTSYGREILLRAKEAAESLGYDFLHAITDSIFIKSQDGSPIDKAAMENLCNRIFDATGIEMAIEGSYKWVIFFPSKVDEQSAVANRYAGLFEDGKLKIRGVISRRKDMPVFVKAFQTDLLELMRQQDSVHTLRSAHPIAATLFNSYAEKLRNHDVTWQDLLLRRTASRKLDEYSAAIGTSVSLGQLLSRGIEVQPGEKVRYLVIHRKSKQPQDRYLSEELAVLQSQTRSLRYDLDFYFELLLESFEEVWQFFAPNDYFPMLRRNGIHPNLFSNLTYHNSEDK